MRRLIIDAGSTKTEWILMDEGEVVEHFERRGYNPNYNDDEVLRGVLRDLPSGVALVDEIDYYGSGCGMVANQEKVAGLLRQRFAETRVVKVTHDLMAVCHALLGRDEGIACILGTGANSCLYDGKEVVDRGVSLGYLVGDEGSGCYLGRKLVRAYFYGLMPDEVKLQFNEDYHLEINDFIDQVYHGSSSSRYLAGFARFAGEHQEDAFVRSLVKECFRDFIEVFVLRYERCHELPICFVGGVAFQFQDLLKETMADYGLVLGKVMKSPSEGLIHWYSGSRRSQVI